MATLFVLVGPVAAGKTTLAKKLNQGLIAYVGTDDIRERVFGNMQSQKNNTKVFDIFFSTIDTHLWTGKDVIADATHCHPRDLRATLHKGKQFDAELVCIFVDRPLEVKLRDRGWRSEELVRKYHDRYKRNREALFETAFYAGAEILVEGEA